MSEFQEWIKETYDPDYSTMTYCKGTRNLMEQAFNAGRESNCSQREAYLRGHRAGRKLQREKDAEIVESYIGNFDVTQRDIVNAILEQEITDD